MKVHEFDTVVQKLGMVTKDTKHRHAWLIHDGVMVARTKRSHGDNKFMPEHLICKQLHVNREQFTGLYSCTVTKEKYLQIITEKGIIAQTKKPS
jgi:hypothetical protein